MNLSEQEKKIIQENVKTLTNQRLPNEPIPEDENQPDLFRIRRKLQNGILNKYKNGVLVHQSVEIDFKEVDGNLKITRKGITYVKSDDVQDSEESSEL